MRHSVSWWVRLVLANRRFCALVRQTLRVSKRVLDINQEAVTTKSCAAITMATREWRDGDAIEASAT